MLIGYARISKADSSQSLDLQRDALREAGVIDDAIYEDQASGQREDRPGLAAFLKAARQGDVIVVWRLDRLGRNLRLSQWAEKYEREQGEIRCPQRVRNNARRGHGERVQDRVSRSTGRHRREEMSPQREQREAIPAVKFFRRRILRELKKIKLAWQGLNYATAPGTLILLPSKPAIAPAQHFNSRNSPQVALGGRRHAPGDSKRWGGKEMTNWNTADARARRRVRRATGGSVRVQ